MRLSKTELIRIVQGSDVAATREDAVRVVERLTRRRRRLVVPRIFDCMPQKASSCRLVVGYYDFNPGEVRCPLHRRCKHKPQFLIRHHSLPFELWSCQGCRNLLIKVKSLIG